MWEIKIKLDVYLMPLQSRWIRVLNKTKQNFKIFRGIYMKIKILSLGGGGFSKQNKQHNLE